MPGELSSRPRLRVDPVGYPCSKPIPVRLGPSSGMPEFSPGPWCYPRVFSLPGDRNHLSDWPLGKRGKKDANRDYSGSKQNRGQPCADILSKPEIQSPSAVFTPDSVNVCAQLQMQWHELPGSLQLPLLSECGLKGCGEFWSSGLLSQHLKSMKVNPGMSGPSFPLAFTDVGCGPQWVALPGLVLSYQVP